MEMNCNKIMFVTRRFGWYKEQPNRNSVSNILDSSMSEGFHERQPEVNGEEGMVNVEQDMVVWQRDAEPAQSTEQSFMSGPAEVPEQFFTPGPFIAPDPFITPERFY